MKKRRCFTEIEKGELKNETRSYCENALAKDDPPSITEMAKVFNIGRDTLNQIIKEVFPNYLSMRESVLKNAKSKLINSIMNDYTSQSKKGLDITHKEISEKYNISLRMVKKYFKDMSIYAFYKKDVIKMFKSGATTKEIKKKYPQLSIDTIDRWLIGLKCQRLENDRNIKMQNAKNFYLDEIRSGKVPSRDYLRKHFHLSSDNINNLLKDVEFIMPENGICELEINGEKKLCFNYQAMTLLFGRSVSTLMRRLKKDKIPSQINKRTLLTKQGNKIYLFPIMEILDYIPEFKEIFDQINLLNEKFSCEIAMSEIPANLKKVDYAVLYTIINYQEKFHKKPTLERLQLDLDLCKFRKYCINTSVQKLKKLQYILETDWIYLIQRGTRKLLLEKGEYFDKDKHRILSGEVPRMYTIKKDYVITNTNIEEPNEIKTSEEVMMEYVRKINNAVRDKNTKTR